MFDFLKRDQKTEFGYIVSPQVGIATSVQEIPDEVFSEKILGDGAAIIPSENNILSPVDGEIVQVADTGHAFCIRSKDGVDILIHVGVVTVGLKGRGFETFVSKGQKVKVGKLIGRADIELIEQSGFSIYTAVLITNMNDVENLRLFKGPLTAGKTKILSYRRTQNIK